MHNTLIKAFHEKFVAELEVLLCSSLNIMLIVPLLIDNIFKGNIRILFFGHIN